MTHHEYWQAVLARDTQYDGQFVYAVRSTGVYCRPSCASRRPSPDHVQFFASPVQAEAAGFRACRRCQPNKVSIEEPHRDLMQQVCRYLEQPRDDLPTLDKLAQRFHLSPYHLQRTFKRMIGVTPRQYAAARRLERFKAGLRQGQAITEALYEAGYASSSSLYEYAPDELGMTPALYRQQGQGARITYAITRCTLGWLLVATTDKGICAVRLGDTEAELESTLRSEFAQAVLRRDEADLGQWITILLDYLGGQPLAEDLPLDVQATAFQRRVWQALRAIPYGSTRSYQEVADAIGQPLAVRAVANACATNPVALVIPCHRVVRKDGSLGGYRWGEARKQALLDQEARVEASSHATR